MSPTIQNEESRCIYCGVVQKFKKLIFKDWARSEKKKKKTTKKQASILFLHFAAGVLFLLDDYLKEEKYLFVEDISEHNKAFLTQGCCHAHKNIFMDKLTNIFQKVSHEKTQISYSR